MIYSCRVSFARFASIFWCWIVTRSWAHKWVCFTHPGCPWAPISINLQFTKLLNITINPVMKDISCYASKIGIAPAPPTTFVYLGNKELSAPVHRECRGRTCGANLCCVAYIIFPVALWKCEKDWFLTCGRLDSRRLKCIFWHVYVGCRKFLLSQDVQTEKERDLDVSGN